MIKGYDFKVAGVPQHVDDFFDALAVENSDYHLSKKELKEEFVDGDKVFEYDFDFSKVELIPEDSNPYDSNAVRVEADGHLVGYIGKKDTLKVRELLQDPELYKIELYLAGGNYKLIYEDDDEKLQVEEKSYGYFGDVTIKIGTPEVVNYSTAATSESVAPVQKVEKPANPPKGGGLLIVLSIALIVLSLVLMLAVLPLGLVFLVVGIILLVLGVKAYKSRKAFENERGNQ